MWFHLKSSEEGSGAGSLLLDAPGESDEVFSMVDTFHDPVMAKEVFLLLNLRDGMVVVDATLGMGGHASGILDKISPHGKLVGIDKDEESLREARGALARHSEHCIFVNDDFRNLKKIFDDHGLKGADAFLFDLGISSYQLDNAVRGFGFRNEGPLDMRMDRKSFISAYDLLNNLTEGEISSILWRFGEERFSRRIARNIVSARERAPLSSTKELADLVTRSLPYKARFQKIHPATRTFQALRIAVNRELDALEEALKMAAELLNRGGRICAISFHSLEDRIVKDFFRELSKTDNFKLVFKKILRPEGSEIVKNPRSRSAKMRVIERVG